MVVQTDVTIPCAPPRVPTFIGYFLVIRSRNEDAWLQLWALCRNGWANGDRNWDGRTCELALCVLPSLKPRESARRSKAIVLRRNGTLAGPGVRKSPAQPWPRACRRGAGRRLSFPLQQLRSRLLTMPFYSWLKIVNFLLRWLRKQNIRYTEPWLFYP